MSGLLPKDVAFLAARLEASRQELLDLGMRNPLLNFRPTKAQGVNMVQEESAQILEILVRQGKTMYFLAAPEPPKKAGPSAATDAGNIDIPADDTGGELPALEAYYSEHPPLLPTEAERQAQLTDNKLQTAETLIRLETRLLNTYYTARTSLEETGVNILYLALGRLSWHETESSSEARHAPLVLVPVVLERGTGAERFKLTHSGADVEGNLSLQARLKADFGISLPLPDLEEQSLADYLAAVRAAVAGRPSWAVEADSITLGFFSFSKLMLYRDLDPALWPATGDGTSSLLSHPAIGALLGAETGFPDAAPSVSEGAFLDTESPAAELHQVLDADSSQLLALLAVQEGRNLVVQGPPGTGKSQTIANLLAEAIGAGKKVLFVAEKMAALEVVKRRLDSLGLGAACLELHSHKANKKTLHDELRRTLGLGRPAPAPALDDQTAQLPHLRARLNDYAAAANAPLGRSRRTAQQVAGSLLLLREAVGAQALPRPPFTDLATWTDADATRAENLAARLQATLQKIGPPPQLLFWGTGLTLLLPTDQEALAATLSTAQAAVRQLQQAGGDLASLLGTASPTDVAAADALRPIAQRGYQEAQAAHQTDAPAAVTGLRSTSKALANLLQLPAPPDHAATIALLEAARHTHAEALVAHSGGVPAAIGAVRAAGDELAALLRLSAPTDRAMAEAMLPVATHAALAPPLPGVAVADAFWQQPNSPLPAAQLAATALNALHRQYDGVLLPEAWGQDLAAERAVLMTTGPKWWRFLSGDYRRARRRLQQLWRQPLPQLPAELVATIDAVHEAARHKQTLDAFDALGGRLFGPAWQLAASDWPALMRAAEYLTLTHQLLGQRRLPAALLSYLAANPDAAAVTAPLAALTAALPRHHTALQAAAEACQTTNDQHPRPNENLLHQDFTSQAGVVAVWIARTPRADDVAARIAATEAALAHFQRISQSVQAALPAAEKSLFGLNLQWHNQAFEAQYSALTAWVAATPPPDAVAAAQQNLEACLGSHTTAVQAATTALALDETRRFGPAGTLSAQPLAAQHTLLAAWAADLPAIHAALEWNNVAAAVRAEGRPELLALAETWPDAARHLVAAVRQAWLEFLQRLAYAQFPALPQFERAGHEDAAAQFRAADRASLVQNRARAMQRHFDNLPNPLSPQAGGQMGVIRHEFAKRSRHLPVRRLMQEAGRAVQAIKPVFMMSPLSVASFLPPGAVEFDLVVFDEASQVKPVDALGAIARGRQLVVVGDSKQLPPSSFFDTLVGTGGTADENNVTADIQSILELCKARQMPERMLRWHYRSLHQSLIAASNHLFYENKLVIFPSPGGQGQLGLVYHHLPDTHYERGTTRTNPLEAAAVAAAVLHHARTTPKLTLGVVAFSTVQRQAIQDALEVGLRQHPELQAFFNRHPHEPFFIKNLENVQGDERDVILISIGYGRTRDGYLAMSFGPLNGEGGERRLNVLITRAKQRCEVFTNLTADDLDLSRSPAKGVAALKTFLEFAQHGRLSQNIETGREMDSPFEEAVFRALTARGHAVRPQVGSQGFFIDLAVVDPDQPGRYALGIECDGAMYHSARSARDRDRLRQGVLEAVGWHLHRIWSTDWFRDPERETDRAEQAIAEARRRHALDQPDELEESDEASETAENLPAGFEREAVAPELLATSATAYQLARLPATVAHQELHLHPPGQLANWVTEVVRVESPVHPDDVARRLGQAAGATQVGRRMRASIDTAIRMATALQTVRQQDGFLWDALAPGTVLPLPRDRSALPAGWRKLALIAPQELAQAALYVVRQSFAIEREAVAGPAAKLLGFVRLVGDEPRQLFEEAIQHLLSTNQVTDTNGVLRPAE